MCHSNDPFCDQFTGDSFGAFVERAHFLNTLEDEAMADIIQFPRRLKVFDPDLTAIMGNDLR